MTDFVAIVLAAGQGTRMKSARPKVLHEIAGRPMIGWAIDAALSAGASRVIAVLGYGRDEVSSYLAERYGERVAFAIQEEQRGTGHAVLCALPVLGETDRVLVSYGDCPLLPAEAIDTIVRASRGANVGLLVSTVDDATGYGRIVRDDRGRVVAIREHKDASESERAIREFNPGIYAIEAAFLRRELAKLKSDNAQGELYLTDLVSAAAREGDVIDRDWPATDVGGINDRWDLAQAELAMQARIARAHAKNGVTIRDPRRTSIGADVAIESDAVIEVDVTLRGRTIIRSGAVIDVGAVLEDVEVHAGARLRPYTVATTSSIGPAAQTGPFAHLRPKTSLGPDTRIGNFVETKNTVMGRGSKANHLAYIGDGAIGDDVNVGAGVIFCNYDGYQKHTTTLEDGSFVGSDCQIVAPITVGKGAYVATGTTVTLDVPADALAVGRARQTNKDGYASRLRARLKATKR
jgi:bifunctional UDP-N-acetylglucosamine pyrophosphorylase/glucosamine-1-phosphate N-acetyltransferase